MMALAGCTGGAASRPDTTGEELARVSTRLKSIQLENKRLGEKLDNLEGLLKTRSRARAATVVARSPAKSVPAKRLSRVLKSGIKADPFTLKIQKALKSAAYDPGPSDGMKGPRTTAAIRIFQRDNSLAETGMADPATLALLKRYFD
jgi:peptidoglycan hydrolase-like protein with peptidoglycan-binding domain